MAAAITKKARLETNHERFLTSNNKEAFINAYVELCNERVDSLASLQIVSCDAANNRLFSRATCDAVPVVEELYPFCSLFYKGVEILNNLIENENYSLDDEDTRKLTDPLLSYIFDEKSHKCLQKIYENAENETQVMITLATHFFSKLSLSNSFKMDKYAPSKDTNKCCDDLEKKNLQPFFGDTSIGHPEVWHGNVDIILESTDIGVLFPKKEEPSRRGQTSIDVKFSDLGSRQCRDQALSQTITFSFLQQLRHPIMKHFLIPYILASNKEVQFFFYDSRNDILLQSRKYNFFVDRIEKRSIAYKTVIATWLVLNYKVLCSGPTNNILKCQKAGFPKFAGSAIDIYKSELQFQNVFDNTSGEKRNIYDLTPVIMDGQLSRCPFDWPENFIRRPSHTPKK